MNTAAIHHISEINAIMARLEDSRNQVEDLNRIAGLASEFTEMAPAQSRQVSALVRSVIAELEEAGEDADVEMENHNSQLRLHWHTLGNRIQKLTAAVLSKIA